eukprot:6180260-Pleurochrysis_carterae.AAC.1
MTALDPSCPSTTARWYICAISVAHLPRCRTAAAPLSPRTSRMSVAPSIRHPLPPKSSGSRPAAAAMAFTTLSESVDDHGDTPSAPTKSGVALGIPKVRSAAGTEGARSSHIMRSASYAHIPSAPRGPSRCRLRSGIGVAFARTAASLMGTTWISAHSCPSLTVAGCIHCTDAQVRSRVGSKGRSGGCPTSPARSSRLCATSAAAHSIRACGVPPQPPISSITRKC